MTDSVFEEARNSVERVQNFDTKQLPRVAQLGDELNFSEAVQPAERLIKLFRQFPIEYLCELPEPQLQIFREHSNTLFNILKQILDFKVSQGDAYGTRNTLIQQLEDIYPNFFTQLYPLIAYGATRQRDFAGMELEFRAKVQSAEDAAAEQMKKLTAMSDDASRVFDEAKKALAEQGVSQQAYYFQQESKEHEAEALKWQSRTIWTAVGLGVYALLSAFAHKWEWLKPEDTYQAFQLGMSKLLIFAVLAYMLILSARNFLSHKHNSIINKHRQNALLTFNALVEAAGNDERRDVILTYAAACIFSPQETGYTKSSSSGQPDLPLNIIQALPKLAQPGAAH